MADNEDLVPLEGPGDWKVRRRWHCGIFFLFAKTKTGGDLEMVPLPGAASSADIFMDGNVPRLEDLHIEVFQPGGFNFTVLDNVDWQRSAWEAVWTEAANQRLQSHPPERPWSAEQVDRNRDEIRRAVHTAQRKNAVTAEHLDNVLRLFEDHGVEGVMKETGKSRSYSYQLLARARKESK